MKLTIAGRLVLAVAGVLMAGGLASAQGPGGAGMGTPGSQQHRPPMEGAFGGAGGRMVEQSHGREAADPDRRPAQGDGRYSAGSSMKLIDLRPI